MKEPLVSVVMITYNHAPYITQAIEGVLQQKTNFPFELVIGEDCSTDGTREIVFEYQKKYPDIIRVITSEQNVGATRNLYRTEKNCRGKYIAYCEGDDYWHRPDKLQKQVDYMENHPECGLVCSDYNFYDVSRGQQIEAYNRYTGRTFPRAPYINDVVRRNCSVLSCTVAVRRNLLERVVDSDPILYQSGRFLMGDTQRWVEISSMAEIAYIDEPLAVRRRLIESATKSKDVRRRLRFGKSTMELMIYLVEKYHLPTNKRQSYEAEWCNICLKLAFYEEDCKLADEVRERKKRFTVVEKGLYWGSWYRFVNRVIRMLMYIRRSIIRVFKVQFLFLV